jgi:ATP-binding cassette subfamily B protein
MARIGSESDRISVFLSLHLLDFATDVLMIAMTSIILCRSIRGWRWSRWCRCRSSRG